MRGDTATRRIIKLAPNPSPDQFAYDHAPVGVRTANGFRAEVVGSLLRPDALVSARRQLEAGEIESATFKMIEDRAVD